MVLTFACLAYGSNTIFAKELDDGALILTILSLINTHHGLLLAAGIIYRNPLAQNRSLSHHLRSE